jgi:hypothetical protein
MLKILFLGLALTIQASGVCPDKEVGTGSETDVQLVKECTACIESAVKSGCKVVISPPPPTCPFPHPPHAHLPHPLPRHPNSALMLLECRIVAQASSWAVTAVKARKQALRPLAVASNTQTQRERLIAAPRNRLQCLDLAHRHRSHRLRRQVAPSTKK